MSDAAAARTAWLAFALIAIAGVLLRPAMPIDETRYLSVAWEMWLSGDWLVPSKNFEIYTHKPPLLFWAINAVWSITGVSEIAARLIGPAFAVLTILLTGRLSRRLWPDDTGAGSQAVLALSGMLLFAFYGGLTMFDAALAAATVGAMLALLHAVETDRGRDWTLLGVATAAGVLAKGPVILVHVAPAMLLVPLWAGRARISLRRLAIGSGLAMVVALAVVSLWLVPAILAGGAEYRDAVLWTQSAGRMADSFAHGRPWWFFVALLPALLFPWVLMPGLWRSAIRADWREPGLRLCLVWAGSALVIFSLISGKQAHYLVPELTAAALIVARLARTPGRLGVIFATIPVLVLATAGAAVTAGLLPIGKAADLLHPQSILVAWVLFAVAVCWLAIRLSGLRGGAVLSLGVILSFDLAIGLTDSGEIYDTHGIASAVAAQERNGIAFYGQTYNAEFNFAGRLSRSVANPTSEAELAGWLAANPEGVVIARPDRTSPGWQPRQTILFRNSPYAIWHVADSPVMEPRT